MIVDVEVAVLKDVLALFDVDVSVVVLITVPLTTEQLYPWNDGKQVQMYPRLPIFWHVPPFSQGFGLHSSSKEKWRLEW